MSLTHTCCYSLPKVPPPAKKNTKQNTVGLLKGFLSRKWFEWEVIAKVSYLGNGGSDWQLSDGQAGGVGQGLSVFGPHHAHRGLETES